MPHDCQTYGWFIPADQLINELQMQENQHGPRGWAQSYDQQNAYDALVSLTRELVEALGVPPPGPPAPWNPVGPRVPAGNVAALANAVIAGLPGDEANNPPTPIPHMPGPGWLTTPPNDPNLAAQQKAQDLLDRVRAALDI